MASDILRRTKNGKYHRTEMQACARFLNIRVQTKISRRLFTSKRAAIPSLIEHNVLSVGLHLDHGSNHSSKTGRSTEI